MDAYDGNAYSVHLDRLIVLMGFFVGMHAV